MEEKDFSFMEKRVEDLTGKELLEIIKLALSTVRVKVV